MIEVRITREKEIRENFLGKIQIQFLSPLWLFLLTKQGLDFPIDGANEDQSQILYEQLSFIPN